MSLTWRNTAPSDNAEPETPAAAAGRYSALVERALGFVRDHDGAVHEDLLIVHVFGNRGNVAMWRPLLRTALASCDELSLRGDGYWIAAGVDALPTVDGAPLLREFVAIDVETTGARPATQRIIEVALVRFLDGKVKEKFTSFVNPGRRLPKMIVGLTGIHDADLADQPPFSDIAERVSEFIGASVLVGHNVGFDIGFLDAELQRAGLQALANERVDTVGLATRLLPGIRKPSLDRVAKAVGLSGRDLHRAEIDAELCGQIAIRLVQRARGAGISDIEIVKAIADSATRRPRGGPQCSRAALNRDLLRDIPKSPGVYLMLDRYGHIIYIGKARNLRDRVGSYFSQPVGHTRKMDGLIENLHRIETVVTGSELEALLLESQLIRRYQPRYNTALRSSERYPYIRLDLANPWPRLTVVRDARDDGARYFGPYRNTSGARRTVDFLNDVLPLRTCPRSFKDARSYGSPCIQLDLHKCLGPCTGRVDRADYLRVVRNVQAFLEGDETVLFDELNAGLVAAADRLDFERAARIRNNFASANQIVAVQRQMNDATVHHTLLVVQPSAIAHDGVEIFLVIKGRRWAQITADDGDPEDAAVRLRRAWDRCQTTGLPVLDNSAVDETAILNRWIHQHAGRDALIPLGASMDDPVPETIDWLDLVHRALRLDRSALDVSMLKSPSGDQDPIEDLLPGELTGDLVAVVTPDQEPCPAS